MVVCSSGKQRVATTTAGLRGTEWRGERLPSGVQITVHPLRTADGASVTGYLFRRGGERTVVCSMHPRELVVANYLVPEILLGKCAVWVQGSRSPGNDLRLEHETAVLDLAAGQSSFVRSKASNFPFCRARPVAVRSLPFIASKPAGRPRRGSRNLPGGRPIKLNSANLPPPDGAVFASTHPGQGWILMNSIDPAVIDEAIR